MRVCIAFWGCGCGSSLWICLCLLLYSTHLPKRIIVVACTREWVCWLSPSSQQCPYNASVILFWQGARKQTWFYEKRRSQVKISTGQLKSQENIKCSSRHLLNKHTPHKYQKSRVYTGFLTGRCTCFFKLSMRFFNGKNLQVWLNTDFFTNLATLMIILSAKFF